jgi:hypothetical protein
VEGWGSIIYYDTRKIKTSKRSHHIIILEHCRLYIDASVLPGYLAAFPPIGYLGVVMEQNIQRKYEEYFFFVPGCFPQGISFSFFQGLSRVTQESNW